MPRPYCEKCRKSYVSEEYLNTHMKTRSHKYKIIKEKYDKLVSKTIYDRNKRWMEYKRRKKKTREEIDKSNNIMNRHEDNRVSVYKFRWELYWKFCNSGFEDIVKKSDGVYHTFVAAAAEAKFLTESGEYVNAPYCVAETKWRVIREIHYIDA